MTEKRGSLRIAAAAAAVLAAGAIVYFLVFPPPRTPAPVVPPATPAAVAPTPPPPPASAPARPVVDAAFELREVTGTVETARGGVWVRAQAGDKLAVNDRIRTGADGKARLRDGAGAELHMREAVELEVRELSDSLTALGLLTGKVRAASARGTGRLEIESRGARTVAPAGGRFTVYADPSGSVAVSSEEGAVKVIAHGREVDVPPRQQTVVAPGKAPSDPVAIPDEVFLAVTWPERDVKVSRTTVRGKVLPGTMVRVNGQPALVAADGGFVATVPLRGGQNRIEVTAEDMAGGTKIVAGQVNAHPGGPPVDADPSRMFDPPKRKDPPP